LIQAHAFVMAARCSSNEEVYAAPLIVKVSKASGSAGSPSVIMMPAPPFLVPSVAETSV
jgi:hypothetical protein